MKQATVGNADLSGMLAVRTMHGYPQVDRHLVFVPPFPDRPRIFPEHKIKAKGCMFMDPSISYGGDESSTLRIQNPWQYLRIPSWLLEDSALHFATLRVDYLNIRRNDQWKKAHTDWK